MNDFLPLSRYLNPVEGKRPPLKAYPRGWRLADFSFGIQDENYIRHPPTSKTSDGFSDLVFLLTILDARVWLRH